MDTAELQLKIEELIDAHGFECRGVTPASELKVREEVRGMCASNMCHMYDRNWACPPAVGPIEYFRDKIASLSTAIVFESVAEMEDDFDIDTMMDTEELHKERFEELVKEVRPLAPDALLLGAGTCTICDECAYVDGEPCRFPERRAVSMEAAGLVVSEVCKSAGIPYNHGSDHIAYISCIVI